MVLYQLYVVYYYVLMTTQHFESEKVGVFILTHPEKRVAFLHFLGQARLNYSEEQF